MLVTNILVAVDFRDESYEALEFARTLADALGASLHLLHVIGYPLVTRATGDHERKEALARLDALLDSDDRERRRPTTACRIGTPAREIVDYAVGHTIDLIVMGTHCHGPTHGMAVGSVADVVVGSAPCAVLTVKCAGHAGERRTRQHRREAGLVA